MSRRSKKKRRPGYKGLIAAGAVIAIVFSAAAAPFFWIGRIKSAVYYDYILEYSKVNDVDPSFVLAVIAIESRFRPEAVSRAGAVGLMQIMPTTGEMLADEIGFESYSEEGLKDPDVNIRLGTYYIGKLQKQYGNDVLVLAAYNVGEGRVDSLVNETEVVPDDVLPSDLPWPETKRYVRSVLLIYSFLQVFGPMYGLIEK
jgi:soluble lytic murein transglycosylase